MLIGVAIILSATGCPAQLPVSCKVPAGRGSKLHDDPSAKIYDAARAWFAQHNNLGCALAAFGEGVRLQPIPPKRSMTLDWHTLI